MPMMMLIADHESQHIIPFALFGVAWIEKPMPIAIQAFFFVCSLRPIVM
jgi:hypothetical protein